MRILVDGMRVMLHAVVRPVAAHLPARVLDLGWRCVAPAYAAILVARHRRALSHYRSLAGAPTGVIPTARFACAMALARLRRLTIYLHDGRISGRIEQIDAATPPALWVAINIVGVEAIALFLDACPSVIVRRRYGGEGELDRATAPWRLRWCAHKAAVRQRITVGREVIVGEHPFKYRGLFDGTRHIVVYQDVWDPAEPARGRTLLGRPTPLVVGAIRLAARAGLPIRFLVVEPSGSRWVLRPGDALPPDEGAVCAAVDAEIRRAPWRWALWPEWVAFVAEHGALESPGRPTDRRIEAVRPTAGLTDLPSGR